MIRIRTPSRLHFGLLSVPVAHAPAWPNQEGEATVPRRRFGGVGLMIDRPGITLSVQPAFDWRAEGPLAERALQFAKRFCDGEKIRQAFRIAIESASPEHAGLGTGTQLGLAVARAIADLTGRSAWDTLQLARSVGRGLRSSLGIHGFAQGGFLVEAGKTSDLAIAPLVVRRDFPDDWHVLLITPRGLDSVHGRREIDAFATLACQDRDDRLTDVLCRNVLLGMLPALIEHDLSTFGEAVYDFNRRVGEMFRPAQGGLYAHPRIEQLIRSMRHAGVRAVGQSSWGPTIFAIFPAQEVNDRRAWLVRHQDLTAEEILVTPPCNQGAEAAIGT